MFINKYINKYNIKAIASLIVITCATFFSILVLVRRTTNNNFWKADPMGNNLIRDKSKRTKIVNALFKCIYKDGVKNVTIRKIAEEANVNLGIIHYYFKTKENIFSECIQVLFSKFIYDIERRYKPSDPPEKKLEEFFCAGSDFIIKQKNLFVVFIDIWSLSIKIPKLQKIFIKRYEELSKIMESIIEEGMQKGVFNKVNKHDLSTFFIAAIEGIGLQWHMRKKSFDLNRHFEILDKNLKRIIIKE